MRASQSSHGRGDVCASAGPREAAETPDLRAGVPDVTCAHDKEINRSGSFSTVSPPRLAFSLFLARVSDKWDGQRAGRP